MTLEFFQDKEGPLTKPMGPRKVHDDKKHRFCHLFTSAYHSYFKRYKAEKS